MGSRRPKQRYTFWKRALDPSFGGWTLMTGTSHALVSSASKWISGLIAPRNLGLGLSLGFSFFSIRVLFLRCLPVTCLPPLSRSPVQCLTFESIPYAKRVVLNIVLGRNLDQGVTYIYVSRVSRRAEPSSLTSPGLHCAGSALLDTLTIYLQLRLPFSSHRLHAIVLQVSGRPESCHL